jgi:hypothetical protein
MKGAAQIRPAPARGRDGYGVRAAVAVLAALALPYAEARAACPQELAVYSEREGSAGIDFRPALPGASREAAPCMDARRAPASVRIRVYETGRQTGRNCIGGALAFVRRGVLYHGRDPKKWAAAAERTE